jgi:hypothetical protein
MENAEGARRTGPPSRAAMERAADYNIERTETEKRLSDRYIAVQKRLNELQANKQRGAEAVVEHKDPRLEDLAIVLRTATVEEINKFEVEKEALEAEMEGKGIDPAKYAISVSEAEVIQ